MKGKDKGKEEGGRESTGERGSEKESMYGCVTERMSFPLWYHVSETLLSLSVFPLQEADHT